MNMKESLWFLGCVYKTVFEANLCKCRFWLQNISLQNILNFVSGCLEWNGRMEYWNRIVELHKYYDNE